MKGSNSQLTEIKSQLLPFVYNLSCSYPRMRKRIPFFISELCNNPVVHVKMYCCFVFCGMSIELSINCEDKSMLLTSAFDSNIVGSMIDLFWVHLSYDNAKAL